VVAVSAPVIFAAVGETLTERAGLINLSLDGSLLLSAMVGFAVAYHSGSVALGFGAAALIGGAVAALVGWCGAFLGMSQVAVGFVLSLTCRDLAYFLGNPLSRVQGPQLSPVPLPGISDLPWIGEILFRHSLAVYASLLLAPAAWWFLFRTRAGLKVRAVGEHPAAAYARGIDPCRMQLLCAVVGGALVGLAGACFSLGVKPGWGRPQGAEGMGWIALALVIFGGWHPLKVAAGAILFAFLQVVGIPLQDILPGVPTQVIQVAPFPLMILTLVLIHLARSEAVQNWADQRSWTAFVARSLRGAAPRALGQPLQRER